MRSLRLSFPLLVLLGLLTAPLLAQAPSADGWYTLFDGTSLEGWRAAENPDAFKLEDGVLVIQGNRGHLFYEGPVMDGKFRNFLFEAEVMTASGANGGIFFHTRYQERGWPEIGYESQVNATHGDSIKTGSIYGVVKVTEARNQDDKWYRHEIAVKRDHVEVRIDGRTVVNWREPAERKGTKVLSSGTFALQAHDPGSVVKFRKIRVKPLPEDDGQLSRAERRLLRPGYGWWNGMDYGPFLSSTVEVDREARILKGLTVNLTSDQRVQGTFDTDLLSWGAVFEEPLYLYGVSYNGGHGGNPKVRGTILHRTGSGPGWTIGAGGFDDPRAIPHGPIPTSLGRYSGLHRHADRVVMSYEVGGRAVLDHMDATIASTAQEGSAAGIAELRFKRGENLTEEAIISKRHLNVAGGDREIVARVGDLPAGSQWKVEVDDERRDGQTISYMNATILAATRPLARAQGRLLVTMDRTRDGGRNLAIGSPSSRDAADASRGGEVSFSWVPAFGAPHPSAGASGNALPRLNDGRDARNDDDTAMVSWFDGNDGFRLVTDLGRERRVTRVDTWSWHRTNRAPQRFVLWGHANVDGDASAKDLAASGWIKLATVDTRELGEGGRHASAVHVKTGAIGRFGRLLHVLDPVSNREGQFLTEIDVWTDEVPAPALGALAQGGGVTRSLQFGARGPAPLEVRELSDGSMAVVLPFPAGQKAQSALVTAHDLTMEILGEGGEQVGEGYVRTGIENVAALDLKAFTGGGPSQYPDVVRVQAKMGKSRGAFAVDDIPVPFENPWGSYMRVGGFDFFEDGDRAALCTWNGDVWVVSGLSQQPLGEVTWKRFATGLFETLGLKIVDGVVHVNGKDQITKLHDLNGDGEADHYENFCNLVMTTENFHEFTFDLQTDAEGRFYISKGAPVKPGGRGFDKIVPHNGTVLRIAKDGRSIEVYATGLRAPNGIGIGPDGQVTSGDNEGTWVPHCKLHWFQPGSFQGVIDTAHTDEKPTTYNPPLCWFPMSVDNSGGGQVWVDGSGWKAMEGELLHLSYGQSSIYRVLRDPTSSPVQGGVVKIPVRLGSSAMRGRFHPQDGQLWVCGLKGWQTNAARLGAFQRVRMTGKPMRLPVAMDINRAGIKLTFSEPLDRELAADPKSWNLSWWDYVWGPQYGSPEVSVSERDDKVRASALEREMHRHKKRDKVVISRVQVSSDGREVFLTIPDIQPVMQFELGMDLETEEGDEIVTTIWGTINDPADSKPAGGR